MSEFNALEEAKRCLSCRIPKCQEGCPTGLEIRDFIKQIKENNLEEAAKIIRRNSSLSTICSVVCPHEKQCIGHCILNVKKNPINVGGLEKYVFDNAPFIDEIENLSNKKVAIIGSGPSSIACALELVVKGVKVTMYEKEPYFGGVLSYGIPDFRLETERIKRLEKHLLYLGVEIVYNKELNEEEILALKNTFDDVFIGIGLTKVRKMDIINEDKNGVYDALTFLKDANYFFRYGVDNKPSLKGKTIVVGAGNVAMDAARMALRCDSEKVMIVYRRSLDEAPANKIEIEEAMQEGVEFKFLTNPVEIIIDNNQVKAVKCEIMELTEPDESGRRKPVGTGKYEVIECNNIISAIGQVPNKIFKEIKEDHGYLVCDEMKTSIEHIYAGGDIVLGAKTVVLAQKTGRIAAKHILEDE